MNVSIGKCGDGTSNTSESCTYIDNGPRHIPSAIVVAIYLLILSFNIIGNTIAAIVVIFYRKMQTFTNWMILNLAFADLALGIFCILLEIPLEINKGNWIYGPVVCTLLSPLQTATVFASVFTLTLLSCSRYYALLCPLSAQPRKIHAKLTIVFVWVLSFMLVTPLMAVLHTYDDNAGGNECKETWSKTANHIYTVICFVLQYMIPMLVMVTAYSFVIYDINFKEYSHRHKSSGTDEARSKENKKLTKLLIVITIIFFMCALPFQIFGLAREIFGQEPVSHSIMVICYMFLLLNSALNPILYNVFSSGFREGFSTLVGTVVGCFKVKPKRSSFSQTRIPRCSKTTELLNEQ